MRSCCAFYRCGPKSRAKPKVHYTMVPLLFDWLTATVEPFFPTPPARMTDMLLCASKIAMPTAAHNGNTFTSVPVYGNCISDTKDLLISLRSLLLKGLFSLILHIPHMLIIIDQEYVLVAFETISCLANHNLQHYRVTEHVQYVILEYIFIVHIWLL